MLFTALGIGVQAFLVGLTGAMAPGPVLTITVTETIRRGRRSAIMLMVGHALLELVFIAAFIFGLRYLLGHQSVITVVSLAGGAFLVFTGGSLLFEVMTGRATLDLSGAGGRLRYGPVIDGIATSLSNPYWTIWWVTIGATLVLKALAAGPAALIAFYLGHEGADFAWYGAVIQAVHAGRRMLTPGRYRTMLAVLATLVLGLGLYYAATAGLTLAESLP